jgi:cytochrome b subunit of formate dehydrogenase
MRTQILSCSARAASVLLAALVWLVVPLAALAADAANSGCLSCHDTKAHKLEVPAGNGKPRTLLALAPQGYAASVHARMDCVACHTAITDQPAPGAGHVPAQRAAAVGCADCHQKLWDQALADNTAAGKPALKAVVDNILAWRDSYHARPKKNDASQINATCDGCHDTHSFVVPPKKDTPAFEQWRQQASASCGKTCHADEVDEHAESAHGKALAEGKDAKAAICSDCHGSHAIGNTSAPAVKLAITAACGSCHKKHYQSYKATYHGQITTLGYANTAKCFDCHGSHGLLEAKDPASKVHRDNLLETCQNCHNGKKGMVQASAGFATFQPHARTDDFAKFPQVWLGYRMMVGLLLFTFGFFWAHTALWFYREYTDRKQGKLRPRVLPAALPAGLKGRHVRRFSAPWRIAHLVFALSLMLLTLTGMPLFYPDVAWAPLVMKALGGPRTAGMIHRVSAVVMMVIFVGHLAYMAAGIWKDRKTFRWLGPDSLVPNLKDVQDIVGMFRWFLGRGPRPVFERWTYWEKFDYWAPFWGVAMLAVSGLMLWLPGLTGSFLPGWVFNIAAIFHGEEAFLAVVFLFTVHFFNNHFRPDKFPLDIGMFTGTMSLDEFRHEHAQQYARLVASGELESHLVDAPSAPMTLRSKVVGFVLIVFGLTLLAGVAIGFFGGTA